MFLPLRKNEDTASWNEENIHLYTWKNTVLKIYGWLKSSAQEQKIL